MTRSADNQTTVLLLGSEPVNRSIMKEVLERAGYVVLDAAELGTAAAVIAKYKIDLLVTHPYVEDIPGYEAVRFLRARHHGIPVLMVAGLLNDDRLQYRAELEEFEVFPAPFTADQLLEKLAEVLKRAREGAPNHRGAVM